MEWFEQNVTLHDKGGRGGLVRNNICDNEGGHDIGNEYPLTTESKSLCC